MLNRILTARRRSWGIDCYKWHHAAKNRHEKTSVPGTLCDAKSSGNWHRSRYLSGLVAHANGSKGCTTHRRRAGEWG